MYPDPFAFAALYRHSLDLDVHYDAVYPYHGLICYYVRQETRPTFEKRGLTRLRQFGGAVSAV